VSVALPNMTFLDCGDATEVESVLDVAQAVQGPVYVRMLRGEIPRLFPQSEPMQLGVARHLSYGTDLTLISSGICTEEAMRATKVLQVRGVSIHHVHVFTLKPLDDPSIVAALRGASHGVITMENHTIMGGLGTAVAEVMAENGIGRPLVRIGLQDRFAHGASPRYLMRENGLDALALVGKVEGLIGEKLHIGEDELAAVRLEP